MPGDWIKVENNTPDKPEVHQIASKLGMDPDTVFGKLVRLWIWADEQTIDGNATGVTKTLLDRITYTSGFADAMLSTPWLAGEDGDLVFTNFSRHNGKGAKKRSVTARRVASFRNAPNVTTALPRVESKSKNKYICDDDSDCNDTSVTEPAKKKSPAKKKPASKRFKPPTLKEVTAYCVERGNSVDPEIFIDSYQAKNWMVGKNKMVDWKAAVRNWERQGWGRKSDTAREDWL